MTLHKSEDYVHAALKAGANGYILKDATQEEFRAAVQTVLRGKTYLSMDVSANVITGYLDGGKSADRSSIYDLLTQREREELKLVAEAKSNKFIAGFLNLSVTTVEKHRSIQYGRLYRVHPFCCGLMSLIL